MTGGGRGGEGGFLLRWGRQTHLIFRVYINRVPLQKLSLFIRPSEHSQTTEAHLSANLSRTVSKIGSSLIRSLWKCVLIPNKHSHLVSDLEQKMSPSTVFTLRKLYLNNYSKHNKEAQTSSIIFLRCKYLPERLHRKKGSRVFRPQPGCHYPTLPGRE